MSTHKTEHTYENKDGTPFSGTMRYYDIDDTTVAVEYIENGTVVVSRGSKATAVRKEPSQYAYIVNRDKWGNVLSSVRVEPTLLPDAIGTPVQPPARGTTKEKV